MYVCMYVYSWITCLIAEAQANAIPAAESHRHRNNSLWFLSARKTASNPRRENVINIGSIKTNRDWTSQAESVIKRNPANAAAQREVPTAREVWYANGTRNDPKRAGTNLKDHTGTEEA